MNKIMDRLDREWPLESVLCHVGKGWHGLVTRLVEDLFALGWDGTLLQIKEKFGGLRFYIGASSDAINERIIEAEHESYRTCEGCGAPGTASNTGWITVQCEGCREGTNKTVD